MKSECTFDEAPDQPPVAGASTTEEVVVNQDQYYLSCLEFFCLACKVQN